MTKLEKQLIVEMYVLTEKYINKKETAKNYMVSYLELWRAIRDRGETNYEDWTELRHRIQLVLDMVFSACDSLELDSPITEKNKVEDHLINEKEFRIEIESLYTKLKSLVEEL